MSLIHWYPLNGDLKDYGEKPVDLVNNGATVNTAGKIGNCYSFDGTNDRCSVPVAESITYPFSLCAWIYPTNVSAGTFQYIISYNTASGGSANHIVAFCFNYSSTLSFIVGGSVFTTGVALSNNVWYHVAVTADANKNVISYINGVKKTTSTGGATTNATWITLGARSNSNTGGVGGASYYFTGKLNDVRIYDHALSAKEVKEIAKGLVLHYNFEDPWIEPTTNLISSITGSTLLKKAGNGIDVQTASGDAHCSLNLSTTTVQGNTYTLSFDVSGMGSSDRCSFGLWFSGGVGQKYDTSIHNGHNVIKCTNFPAVVSLLTFDDANRSNTNVIHIRNFQFEAKDHATPYVSGTRSVGTVYDNSGYGYDGTVNGTVEIVSDTASGEKSIKLAASSTQYIDCTKGPFLNGVDSCTFNVWCKPSTTSVLGLFSLEKDNYWRISLCQSTNSVRIRDITDSAKDLSVGTYTANEWAMVSVTYNKGTATTYKNGVQVATASIGGTTMNTNQNWLALGKSHQNSCFYNGLIGDFKIFATALSADDILAEYQRKAAIDKNGNLFTGEFVETESVSSPKVNKTDVVSASSLSEGLITQRLSDGSTWQRVYFFDYDIAGSVFTTETAKSCNTTGKFSVLGSLESYVPESGWYEFYYKERNGNNSNYVRWKQSFNPLSRYTTGTSGTPSEYTFISGTTPYGDFSGLTRYNSSDNKNCYLRGATSWWAAIAPYGTSYDVFPDMWGNSTRNHHQELWIRIDDMKTGINFTNSSVKLNGTAITADEFIEL